LPLGRAQAKSRSLSDPKPLSPGLKLALDLGPVLLFFVTYLWV
jgi:hypothetical protein